MVARALGHAAGPHRLEHIDHFAQLFVPTAYAVALYAIFMCNFNVVRFLRKEKDGTLQMHVGGAGALALELGSQAASRDRSHSCNARARLRHHVEPSTGDLITRD